ncbi:MAG: hypothetical protein KC414_14625, partial [Romboutsia sp.]|nr:hypothetical protein [Romboutsia sp.]
KNIAIKNKKQYLYIWCVFFLFIYVIRIYQGRYITALCQPEIKGIGLSYTFWIANSFGILKFIINHKILSLRIDISIPFLALFILIYSNKKIFPIILFVLFLLQHFCLETYSVTQTKSTVFILLSLFPLIVKEKNFHLMVEFAKYFCCFVLCIAAYYKIKHGVAFDSNHFQKILQLQHIDLALYQTSSIRLSISNFLVEYKTISFILFSLLIIIQYSFIVGFFTNKYNKLLFVFYLLFNLSTIVLMRIYNFEMLMCATLSFLYLPQTILSNK